MGRIITSNVAKKIKYPMIIAKPYVEKNEMK